LQELCRELNQFARRFAEGQCPATEERDGSIADFVQKHRLLLHSNVTREQAQLVATLDRIAEQQLLMPLGGLRHFLSKSADMGKELLAPLQFAARMLTICHMRATSGQWLL